MSATASITDANPKVEETQARLARFVSLRPTDDYQDAAILGCEQVTFRVLGTQAAAPLAAEGFHLKIVLCEPRRSTPLHSYLTKEVFVALNHRWEVFRRPGGERHGLLKPWNTVSFPPACRAPSGTSARSRRT